MRSAEQSPAAMTEPASGRRPARTGAPVRNRGSADQAVPKQHPPGERPDAVSPFALNFIYRLRSRAA